MRRKKKLNLDNICRCFPLISKLFAAACVGVDLLLLVFFLTPKFSQIFMLLIMFESVNLILGLVALKWTLILFNLP